MSIACALVASLYLNSTTYVILISIVVLLVILWTNEGLPLGVVSLLPLILFPAFGVTTLPATANNYANPVIFLFLGSFMLAIVIQNTGLHRYIAEFMLPKQVVTPRRIIFSFGLISALLSSLLSNTTTSLLLLPVALYISDERIFQSCFVLAIAYGASIGGIITPIGIPPNPILTGFMEV